MIEMGYRVKDTITGFEGICTAVAQYITGCNQFLINPPMKDGRFEEPRWFDEERLAAISNGPVVEFSSLSPVKQTTYVGGPQTNPAPTK